jgi:hypothetical protein
MDKAFDLSGNGDSSILMVAAILAAILVVVTVGIIVLRRTFYAAYRIPKSMEFVVLKVLLPRETLRMEQQQKDWRDVLAGFETLFMTLAGIQPHDGNALARSWKEFWFGKHHHLAFEIVAHQGLIHFYFAVPKDVRQLVELQVQAQYPQAHIEIVHDYNLFAKNSAIRGTMLSLSKSDMFP